MICGVGTAMCCAVGIGFVFLAVFTGRALVVPTAFSLLPQIFGVGMDSVAGFFDMFGGGGDDDDDKPKRSNRDEAEAPEGEKPGGGMSAAERIRARRERFSGGGLTPSAEDAPDSLTPEKKQWEPGGQRGPIEDRFKPQDPNADDFDSDSGNRFGSGRVGNRPGRDSRKREWHEDEFFGGAMDDDGDGFADR